jgi:hypothetical protein
VITYLVEAIEEENNEIQMVVTLLSIYDKSEVATVSDTEIKRIIDNLSNTEIV